MHMRTLLFVNYDLIGFCETLRAFPH